MGVLLCALRSVDFLDGCADAVVGRFMLLGRSADYSRGHRFWQGGAPPKTLIIAVTGEVKLSARNARGREFIDRFLTRGECAGLVSALHGLPYPTDARVTRGGEVFTIKRAAFVRFLDEQPGVRSRAMRTIGARYRRALKERNDLILRPAPQRVAEFLLRRASGHGADGGRILLRVTHAEIAARVGTVREVVTRILRDFQMRGLVGRDDRGLYVRDREGLAAESGVDFGEEASPIGGALRRARPLPTDRAFAPMAHLRRSV